MPNKETVARNNCSSANARLSRDWFLIPIQTSPEEFSDPADIPRYAAVTETARKTTEQYSF